MAADDVIVQHNGRAYTGWKDITISQDFDSSVGTCQITLAEQPGNPLPWRLGDDVVVLLGSALTPVITGYVKQVDGTHSADDHQIVYTIADQTRFFVQSTLGPGKPYDPPIAPADLGNKLLQRMGLSKIKVIDMIGLEPFKEGEIPQADIDERGHAFFDSWVSKRQAVQRTDGKGNIVLDRNQGRMGPGFLHKGPEDDPLNNVLSSKYNLTDDGRHNSSEAASQKSPNDKPYWEGRPKGDDPAQSGPLATAWGKASDPDVRKELKRHYRAIRGLNNDTPDKSAKWMSNLARARGYTYDAEVYGFEPTLNGQSVGSLWFPGVLVPVYDFHFGVSDVLFLKGCTWKKSDREGAKTELRLTYKDAFTTEAADSGKGGRSRAKGLGA